MGSLFGSDKGAKIAKQQQEAQQRRSLAELAKQQAEVDQATAKPGGGSGRRFGRGLLTFLNDGGAATLG